VGATTGTAAAQAAQKNIAATERLHRQYTRREIRDVSAEILVGPAKIEFRLYARLLKALTPDTEAGLVEAIRCSPNIRALPPRQKFTVAMITANQIARVRTRAGLDPVADSLNGHRTAFEQIRGLLA
jgi:hypothetical protein